jgi:hypothetical protein
MPPLPMQSIAVYFNYKCSQTEYNRFVTIHGNLNG